MNCRIKNYFILFLFSTFICTLNSAYSMSAITETRQRFHPKVALHGMVAAQEKQAAQIGRDILKKGGNAVDAAVAVGFALAVTLPRAGNIGGGGFMVIWLANEKRGIAIDYRETAPAAATPAIFIKEDGSNNKDMLYDSYSASGVPGTVAGLCLAEEKYGRLNLKTVMKPAIKLARNGIVVSADLAQVIQNEKERLSATPEARKLFFTKQGELLRQGDRLIQTDLANSLEKISIKGPDAFYRGAIAQKIIRAMKLNHGLIEADDLKNYHAEITEPVIGHYKGYTVLSMPPPSSGGVSLIELLNVLNNFPLEEMGLNSAKSIHILAESMNLVYRDRNHLLGDPDFVKNPIDRLTSLEYAKKLSRQINLNKHTPASKISIHTREKESRETTHYSIVDDDGNMVANTYTLNFSFGNAKMIDGAGFFMNNELDDFTIQADKPNVFGLLQGKQNLIAPGKRPLSSMTPTIVLDENKKAVLATGSPGGSRIITTVLQVILNAIEYRYNIATSVNLPRMHSQLWPDKLYLEEGISLDTQRLLRAMHHDIEITNAMGSAQTVAKQKGKALGAADPRRMGAVALGY